MLVYAKQIADWFLKAGRDNQVIIMFLFLTGLLTYDRITSNNKIISLEHAKHIADSSNASRFNATVADFQKKIEDCNAQRIKEFIEQNKAFQKKYEEMFKQSDKYYFEIQKLKSQQQ